MPNGSNEAPNNLRRQPSTSNYVLWISFLPFGFELNTQRGPIFIRSLIRLELRNVFPFLGSTNPRLRPCLSLSMRDIFDVIIYTLLGRIDRAKSSSAYIDLNLSYWTQLEQLDLHFRNDDICLYPFGHLPSNLFRYRYLTLCSCFAFWTFWRFDLHRRHSWWIPIFCYLAEYLLGEHILACMLDIFGGCIWSGKHLVEREKFFIIYTQALHSMYGIILALVVLFYDVMVWMRV